MPQKALILCTGNSCRSQMAEGLWRHLGGDEWEVSSAGSQPAGFVHPLAIKAMNELGVDISGQTSKHVDEVATQELNLVVTVCDNARESCPVLPGARTTRHWPFDDPAAAGGSDAEQLAEFRRVRDEIRARIKLYLERGR